VSAQVAIETPKDRERTIDLRASAVAALATALFSIGGAIVNIARTGGDPGPYGMVCVVFVISYGVSLAVLRRRT
jgi:hypothetical protein